MAIEIRVKVLHHEDEKSIIGQYIIFCKVYTQQLKRYGRDSKAVTETIRICKDRNILKDYLESREQEVADMMTILKDDWIYAMHEKDIANKVATATARRLIQKGKMSLEDIAACVPSLSMKELSELQAEIMK